MPVPTCCRPRQQKVIQITRPNGGDGKSALAANLTVSIAQSGRKIVLLDTDLRRSRVQAILRSPDDIRLSSVVLHHLPDTWDR